MKRETKEGRRFFTITNIQSGWRDFSGLCRFLVRPGPKPINSQLQNRLPTRFLSVRFQGKSVRSVCRAYLVSVGFAQPYFKGIFGNG